MKNKKLMIVICIAIILMLIIGIVLFIKKKNSGNTEIYQKKPDTVIKSTRKNPIKLEGF